MESLITTIVHLEYTNLADMIYSAMLIFGIIVQLVVRLSCNGRDEFLHYYLPAYSTYVIALGAGVIVTLITLYFDMYYAVALIALAYLLDLGFMMWDMKADRWYAFTPREQYLILFKPSEVDRMLTKHCAELGVI